LLWFGGASVATSLIIGLQVAVVPRLGADLGRSALVIPGWGFIATAFAFVLRRRPSNRVLSAAGAAWLLVGFIALWWFARSNV
jgi:hypothetical protein